MLYQRINYFLEVANRLSFSEAARHKYISQQSMSWHISSLEKELGVKLFVRSTRSVNLTSAGVILRDEFTRINNEIEISISRIRNLVKDDSPVFSIGFFEGLSYHYIIDPLLKHLMEIFPEISFDVFLSDMSTVRNYLIDGRIDLCITTADDWKEWPDIKAFILQKYTFNVIISSRMPGLNREEFRLSDLERYTMFGLPHARIYRSAPGWQDYVPRKDLVTLNNLPNILVNIRCLRGFACLPKVFDGVDSEEYYTFPLPFEDAEAKLLCALRGNLNNQLLESVVNEVREYYKEMYDLQ